MTQQFRENTSFVLNVIKLASIIIGCIAAVTFFIYQTQGLPPRVSKLEVELNTTKQELKSEMNNLKSEMDRSAGKQDIMLEDIKIIKTHLLNK